MPHALTTEELPVIRDEFVAAARRAIDAGLDGVEVHGANGYLLHEFLSPSANRREDAFGGSPAARAAFVVEVVTAVAAEVGAGRVGLRLSPAHNIQDIDETDPADVRATYEAVVDGINPLGVAYLSVLHAEPTGELVQDLRARFDGVFIANSGFGQVTTKKEAEHLVESGSADAVAVAASRSRTRTSSSAGRAATRRTSRTGDVLWRQRRGLHGLPAPQRLTSRRH